MATSLDDLLADLLGEADENGPTQAQAIQSVGAGVADSGAGGFAREEAGRIGSDEEVPLAVAAASAAEDQQSRDRAAASMPATSAAHAASPPPPGAQRAAAPSTSPPQSRPAFITDKPPQQEEQEPRQVLYESSTSHQPTTHLEAASDREAQPPVLAAVGTGPGEDDDDDDLLLEGLEDLLAQGPGSAESSAPASPQLTAPGPSVKATATSAFAAADRVMPGPWGSQAGGAGSAAAPPVPALQQMLAAAPSSPFPDPSEQVLQEAEDLERSLLTGVGGAGEACSDPGEQLQALLANAREDWPEQGRPDATGAMVGGHVALRLEEALVTVPELGAALRATGAATASAGSGAARVVALQGTVLAVGTATGVTLAAHLPSMNAAAAAAVAAASRAGGVAQSDGSEARTSGSGTAGQLSTQSSQGPGAPARPSTAGAATPPVLTLGEPRSEAEAVTALGFSRLDTPADPLWLLVGHASGTVAVWELQRRGPRLLFTIGGQHGLPVTHASFIPGRGVSQAVTVDRRGRLVVHIISTNMLLMRTTAASKPLLDGSLGIISDVVHLQPFAVGAASSSSGMPGPAAAGPDGKAPPGGPASGAGTTLGDGVAALCTPTGCHIARFRPSGELALLMVIPRPEGAAVLPTAAWANHVRRATPPAVLTATVATGPTAAAKAGAPPGAPGAAASVQSSLDTVSVPCAGIAVSWGPLVLFCDIPLLGDHRGSSLQPIDGAAPPSSGGAGIAPGPAAGGAQAVGLSLLRSMTAAAAATANRVTGPSIDPLSPHLVKQLAMAFPVQVLRKWHTSALEAQGQAEGAGPPVAPGAKLELLHVLGLHWFDGEALAVVVQQGLQVRLAVLSSDLEVREQIDCFDTPPPSPYLPSSPAALCCPGAVAGCGSRVVMLGTSGGLHCCRLMGWQERLRTLQDVGKLQLALYYGLEFFKLHQAKRHAAAAAGVAPAQSDLATAQQQSQWLLGLLAAHTRDELHACVAAAQASDTGRHVLPSVVARVHAAAQLAICCCLLLGLQQPLFQDVFQLFKAAQEQVLGGGQPSQQLPGTHKPSVGNGDGGPGGVLLQPLGIFLEALEPHILADRLPCPAPELVHALVEHFAAPGPGGAPPQPARVERCVLHLDVFHLDLDQVLRLCMARGLYSALTYVHNRIGEYRQPVLDMLAFLAGARPASTGPPGPLELARVARKLLVYLRCMFRGEAFPPGSGQLGAVGVMGDAGAEEAAALASQLRAQLLGLLLFTETQDLAQEWRLPLPAVRAVVSDPYPCLQLLLSTQPAATVHVLGQAVDGWDAVETELRAAAGKAPQEMDSVLVATQVLVNALVALLGRPTAAPGHPRPGVHSAPLALSRALAISRAAILDFVTALVVARRVTVSPPFLLQLLHHVLEPPAGSTVLQLRAPAVSVGMGSTALLPGGAPPPPRPSDADGADRDSVAGAPADEAITGLAGLLRPSSPAEQLAMAMLDVVGVNSVVLPGARQAADRLGPQESAAAAALLLQHGMRLGAAHVHHLRGEVQKALLLHLQLPEKTAAFAYIHGCIQSGQAAVRQALLAAVVAAGRQLVAASPSATAAALLALGPAQQPALLAQLQAAPEERFQVLRALMALSERLQNEAQQQGHAEPEEEEGGDELPRAVLGHREDTPAAGQAWLLSSSWGDESDIVTPLATLLLPPGTPAVPRAADLRTDPAACDDYVALACQYTPACVLPFLLRHTVYNVRVCLAAVQRAGVNDATAYLLERLGELDHAFSLHLARIDEGCTALEAFFSEPGFELTAGSGEGGALGTEARSVVVEWLLALSPRLRTALPKICGRDAWEAAQQRGEAQRRQRSCVPPTSATPAALPPAVPPPLALFWVALCSATSFCRRCSRAAKLGELADGQTPGQQPNPSGGGPAQQSPGSPTPGAAARHAAAGYWLRLLEVYVRRVRAHTVAEGVSSSLRCVLAAAVEDVIGCASDHVPPSALVTHISAQHGSAAVGDFRGLLEGLLSACSYEQAIMQAALRLLAHDALGQVRSRCLRHSQGLSGAEVDALPAKGEDLPLASTLDGGSGGPAGPRGVLKPLSLVTDKVNAGLMAVVAGIAQQSGASGPASAKTPPPGRGGGRAKDAAAPILVLVGHAAGPATVVEDGLCAAGLDPATPAPLGLAGLGGALGDFEALRARGGRSAVRAEIRLSAVLQELGLAPRTQVVPAVGSGEHSVNPAARDASFDVDNLLSWATSVAS